MTPARLALLAFLAGTASGMTGSALLREAPGAKTYFTRELVVWQEPLADGGSDVTAQVSVDATLALNDGGTQVVRLNPVLCPLTEARKTSLRTILAAAANCARDAP